jgi:glycosyltransferase involved in cell wall biosynthesis
MKIAIASLGDPLSVGTWSGIPAYISNVLIKKGHEIIPVSLQAGKESWYYNWLRRYYHRVLGKWFLCAVEQRYLRQISSQFDEQVNRLRPDVVLSIHADWLAYSSFSTPACIIHDATFATLVDYYPSFSNLSKRSLRLGHEMYQRSINKAAASVFSAEWASQSAIRDYGASPAKVFTISFGANLDPAPDEEDVAMWIQERTNSDRCNFVFIGTQWKRKGGPDVLFFVRHLRHLGINASLTVIGCSPEIPIEMKQYVTVLGYLRKDNPAEEEKLRAAIRSASALIVLSHAECFGCIYCEANAYAIPAIGRDTGGVSEIIRQDTNGLLLGKNETPEELAERWARIWKDKRMFKTLCVSSRAEYKTRLNYDVFTSKLEDVLHEIVKPYYQTNPVV